MCQAEQQAVLDRQVRLPRAIDAYAEQLQRIFGAILAQQNVRFEQPKPQSPGRILPQVPGGEVLTRLRGSRASEVQIAVQIVRVNTLKQHRRIWGCGGVARRQSPESCQQGSPYGYFLLSQGTPPPPHSVMPIPPLTGQPRSARSPTSWM